EIEKSERECTAARGEKELGFNSQLDNLELKTMMDTSERVNCLKISSLIVEESRPTLMNRQFAAFFLINLMSS
ncbi:hypothetical protein LINPERHAP1_LOCUS5009, partial [Linum perenne]